MDDATDVKDLAGIREQIRDNVEALVPFCQTGVLGDKQEAKFRIVVGCGDDGVHGGYSYRAAVVWGPETKEFCSGMIRSSPRQALLSLLSRSSQFVGEQMMDWGPHDPHSELNCLPYERRGVAGEFARIFFKSFANAKFSDCEDKAVKLERALVLHFSGPSEKSYQDRAALLSNAMQENKTLLSKFDNGVMTAEMLVTMNAKNLANGEE